MPSPMTRVVNWVTRVAVKGRLPRPGAADPGRNVAHIRAAFATPVFPQPGGRYRSETIASVPGLWTEPAGAALATVLFLHGGGYVGCSPKTHRPITCAYARRGFRVFAPDYRLAPEHRFPAAVDDALAVYRALLAADVNARRLIISGDSAGGGLTLATLVAARRDGLPVPACGVLLSPWADLALTGDSIRANAGSEPMLTADALSVMASLYLGAADARDPLASPLYADLTGLPPLAIHASDIEVLRDDATRLAERARAAGVEVALTLWPGQAHDWAMFQLLLPEARQTMNEVATFITARL